MLFSFYSSYFSKNSTSWFNKVFFLNIFFNNCQREFKSNQAFQKNFYLKCSLAFAPPEIIRHLNYLINQRYEAPREFNEYFEAYWIPLRKMFSTLNSIDVRTNNVMEGFNSAFGRCMGSSNNFWKFLVKIINEESIFYMK